MASVEERAERRFKENQEKGIETDFETLKAEIERRDYLDSTREVSPLVQASDAVKIDTTGLTIEEVVAAIQNVIKQKGFELLKIFRKIEEIALFFTKISYYVSIYS